MSQPQKNVCDHCYVLDVTTCPILDRAYRKGLEGMEKCEMKEAIDKVAERVKKTSWNARKPPEEAEVEPDFDYSGDMDEDSQEETM
jgi:hypothetical protein